MSSLVWLVISLGGAMLLHRYYFKERIQNLQTPPGAHWLWGHEKAAFDETCGAFYSRWFEQYGPAFKIRGAFGYGEILVVGDPEALAHIFIRRTYDYVKSPVFRPLIERLLGRSVIWVEDADEHSRMRRFMSPCFTAQQIRANTNEIASATRQFEQKLRDYVVSQNGNATINLLDWTWKVTLDIIGQVGFSHDFRCGESEDGKAIAKAWHDQVNMAMNFGGFVAPLLIRQFPWIVNLPVEAIQAPGKVKTIVKRLGKEFIERQETVNGTDLLSVLIRENSRVARDEQDSTDQLLDHTCTFVMAGHETVAGALNYTLWELAKNPSIQDKLRAELQAFDGEPTYDDFQRPSLAYLDAVLKEILRLHGPSSHMEKVALKDDVIPFSLPVRGKDGKLVTSIPIKAGQMIYIPSISAQRLSSVWGDGDVFRPERWLAPNELPPDSVLHKGWSKLFAFSQGARNCIGTRLAIYEYKVVLTTLIRNFVFHDTGAEILSRFTASLQPRVVGKEQDGPALPCRITLSAVN
ncbi:cytochrome P450 [Exidia glandulosa HHB12029]|uniref:Cytochrome P450 n=1 Tax=Exidia glandulosa HHB12029 TaxID=1314781 RepID=A0A165LPJ7_EXIGL|nr:cytochrome P450 [Exidia glandulosa HHB12029]